MKGYLDLVPISAKVHKKQSRMSVFLYYPFGVSRNGYFRYGGYVYPGTDFAGSVLEWKLAYWDPGHYR